MAYRPVVMPLEDCPDFEPVAGIRMRGLRGERLHANVVAFEPNAVLPLHAHDNEQMGYVLSGDMIMTIDDVDYKMTAGMIYTIPGGISHKVVAGPEGVVVLDIFSPPRSEYPAADSGA